MPSRAATATVTIIYLVTISLPPEEGHQHQPHIHSEPVIAVVERQPPVVIQQAAGFTADAVISASVAGSFTADAVIVAVKGTNQ